MEENLHTEQLLRESFASFTLQPELRSFDVIVSKMQAERRRRFFLYFRQLGLAVLFLAGLSLAGIMLYERSSTIVRSDLADVAVIQKTEFPAKSGNNKMHLDERNLSSNAKTTDPPLNEQGINPRAIENNFTGRPGGSADRINAGISERRVRPAGEMKDHKIAFESASGKKKDPVQKNEPVLLVDNEIGSIERQNTASEITSLAEPIQPEFLISIGIPSQNQPELIINEESVSLIQPKKFNHWQIVTGVYYNGLFTRSILGTNGQGKTPYLQARKESNTFNYNFAAGIRLGFVLNNKWQVLFGYGNLRYRYQEPPPNFAIPTTLQSFAFNTKDANESSRIMQFNYRVYSAECSRLLNAGRLARIKAGMLFEAQHFRFHHLAGVNENEWLYSIGVRAGLIEDIGSRFQLQVSPNLFCSLNSMFNRNYEISQRAFGVGLEAMLVFKIYR